EDDPKRGHWFRRRSRLDCGTELAKHFRCGLDAGQAPANHKDGVLAGRRRAGWQCGDVVVEPSRHLVRIDIKSVGLKAGDRGSSEAATKSEDESVVWEGAQAAVDRTANRSRGCVDASYLPFHMLD